MKTITYKLVIPTDRRLYISLPEDVPPGPAEVVVIVAPETARERGMTAGDLLRSPLFGLWRERTDIGESIEYARELRAKAERRSRE